MRRFHPNIEHESYHSVWFWMHLLRHKRRYFGTPLNDELDRHLVRHVRALFQNWTVAMRYRPEESLVNEAATAYASVTWLREHYLSLWS
jgi:hypothetical protein